MTADLQIISFVSAPEWEAWLDANHTRVEGVWLRLFS